jgi:hypothetical protein
MYRVKTPSQLGAVIRATRTSMNLPATDFAAIASASPILLRRIEDGRATKAIQTIFTVLDELGIEIHLATPPSVGAIDLPKPSEKPKRTRVRR